MGREWLFQELLRAYRLRWSQRLLRGSDSAHDALTRHVVSREPDGPCRAFPSDPYRWRDGSWMIPGTGGWLCLGKDCPPPEGTMRPGQYGWLALFGG